MKLTKNLGMAQHWLALTGTERVMTNALVCVWIVDEGGVHNHLSVQPGVPGHQTRQLPVMHVSPIHPARALPISGCVVCIDSRYYLRVSSHPNQVASQINQAQHSCDGNPSCNPIDAETNAYGPDSLWSGTGLCQQACTDDVR